MYFKKKYVGNCQCLVDIFTLLFLLIIHNHYLLFILFHIFFNTSIIWAIWFTITFEAIVFQQYLLLPTRIGFVDNKITQTNLHTLTNIMSHPNNNVGIIRTGCSVMRWIDIDMIKSTRVRKTIMFEKTMHEGKCQKLLQTYVLHVQKNDALSQRHWACPWQEINEL